MGTSKLNRHKLTPYEMLPTQCKELEMFNDLNLYNIKPFIEALRTWNRHGSANNLERWARNMHQQIDVEWDTEPLGIVSWNEIDSWMYHLRRDNKKNGKLGQT